MNILMIGFGRELAESPDEESISRHLDYAKACGGTVSVICRPAGMSLITRLRKGFCRPTVYDGVLRVVPAYAPFLSLFPFAAELAGCRLWNEQPFDLIYARDPFLSALAGVRLARRFNVGLIIGNHSNFVDDPVFMAESPLRNFALNRLARHLLPKADMCRVCNERERQRYIRRLNLPEDRVQVSNVPLDLTPFASVRRDGVRAQVRAELGVGQQDKLIVWAGRVALSKRLEVLLLAFAHAAAQQPGAKLLLIGRGTQAVVETAYATNFGRLSVARSRVLTVDRFVSRGELARYFAASDILAHAALREGFGRTLVEAGAAGLPVVASPSAGAEMLITPGHNGLLAVDGGYAALAGVMERLLADPGLALRLGEGGRTRALTQFDREAMLNQVVQLWRDTLELRRQSA